MWIASIFGPILAIVGLWMLLYTDNLAKVLTGIKNSPPVFYLGCIMNFIVGMAILTQYSTWSWDTFVLVTLLGWVLVLRAVVGLYLPQLLIKFTMTNNSFTKIMGIIPLVWGLALCWLAYFM